MLASLIRIRWALVAAMSCFLCDAVSAVQDEAARQAAEILQTAGVSGGLVVQLNCGDGELTAALCQNDRLVVQGLDADPDKVAAARRRIQATGLYGRISVRRWDGDRLPYGDNLINLLICPADAPIRPEEIDRVLRPGGVVLSVRKIGERLDLQRRVKPVPDEIDDWTHYLHDSGNNAVAQDDRVGPPHHLQWKSGPLWCRSHEFSSSVQAMVSANGRLIGIYDEGIIGQPRGVPAFWALVARDAFNGIQLWRRPCARIAPHALAAVGDRVYVTLTSKGPLSILDAATGETLQTCDQTGNVSELALCEGRVILNTQLPDEAGKPSPHIAAASPEDGQLLWKHAVDTVDANTMVAGEGRICYVGNGTLACLSMDRGKELWRSDLPRRGKGYAVLYNGVVFVTGGATRAFDLETGKLLWTGPDGSSHARNPPGLFGAQGLVWRAWEATLPRSFVWQHEPEIRNGLNVRTGEIEKTIRAERLVTAGHHIRCYPPKATRRYLLLNKRGVEFFDLEGTNHMRANWTRAACGFGMLPANGFLYTPPSQCFCYPGVLLSGLNALASTRETPPLEPADQGPRLETGPAFERMTELMGQQLSETDWPTYRHDPQRSGAFPAELPARLDRVWETRICPPALPPREGQPIADEVAGQVVLKAEAATIHGKGAHLTGGKIAAWRGKDTTVSWTAKLPVAGKLPVWVSQANQGAGGSTFELSVGEQKLAGTIQHTSSWDDYIWVRVGDVVLDAPGEYTVRVTPTKQVDGRLGNLGAVVIGGTRPPAGATERPKLREYPVGELTPPVAAGERIFVARPDAHTVHAISATDGRRLWSFTADGRIDSPPSIYRGLCVFGSTDGYVYCLAADDGQLAWRFRAAPEERQICVMGQIESAWPVHGSVLIRDDKIYCTAGRSSYLDGGIILYALEPTTGQVLYQTLLQSEEPDVTVDGGRPFDMEGSRSDILVAGQKDIYLYQNRFDSSLTPQPMPRVTKLGDRRGEPHLMTTDGFLDKTWFNRTYWTYGDRWPGYYFTYRAPKSGQLLVFDKQNTYALKVYTERRGHSPEFAPGSGYLLNADRNSTQLVLDEMDIGAEKGRGFTRTELPIWAERVPIRGQGMLLAGDHLYIVGPPDLASEQDAYEAMIGRKGAIFRVANATDGQTQSEFEMAEVPVFDGLIAAGARLFMVTKDGTLICFGAAQQ